MKILILYFGALLLTGCSRGNEPLPPDLTADVAVEHEMGISGSTTNAEIELTPALQAELENIANCFFDATSILQDEPAENGSLALFLSEAKDKRKTAGTGSFDLLRWDESGERIMSSDGHPVSYRIAGLSRDHFDNGAEATFTTYEFFTKESVTPARTTVTLWIGTPPQ